MNSNLKTGRRLSILVLLLAIIASAGGLLLEKVYRDIEWIRKAWWANDVVTLFVVVPLLVFAITKSRNSLKMHLVWMGAVGYLFYNYAFYLFGAAFNDFFLVYAAIVSLSIYILILGMMAFPVNAAATIISKRISVRIVSAFLLFLSVPLLLVEGGAIFNFVINKRLPEVPVLIYALDFVFIIPNIILAAVLLWMNKNWGYILSVIMLVKGVTYGLGLILAAASVVDFSFQNNWDPLTPFYCFVFGGSLLFLFLLLRGTKNRT